MSERTYSEKWHEVQYKMALNTPQADAVKPEEGWPEWADLSEERKESIRQTNIDYQQWMETLGNSIFIGGILPHAGRID